MNKVWRGSVKTTSRCYGSLKHLGPKWGNANTCIHFLKFDLFFFSVLLEMPTVLKAISEFSTILLLGFLYWLLNLFSTCFWLISLNRILSSAIIWMYRNHSFFHLFYHSPLPLLSLSLKTVGKGFFFKKKSLICLMSLFHVIFLGRTSNSSQNFQFSTEKTVCT